LAPPDDRTTTLKTALAGRYELRHEIGRGGMATVYLALDHRHGGRVAIKVLHPELGSTMGGPRFLREIQIAARLQHPNILPVLDSGEAAGTSYFVMPFVEGESLGQRLTRETRLPVDEAVRLIAEVADGLQHAHEAGFVHRDIKPGNILLSHGHAILADFGVARALDVSSAERLTDSGLAVGTVAYMSPEQAGADKVDGRSDIYSLGCVLYETLAGSPPFTGPSAQAIMARNAIDPVPSIRTVRPGVPPALEAAITRALAKVPQDRFASAREFREEILRAATTPTGSALPPTVPTARRRPSRLPLILAAVLVVAAVAVWLRGNSRPALDPNRVMVFPFVLPSDWSGASTAGEDVATIIGSAMDGAGSLRWVDGWQLLQPAARDNIRLLSVQDAMAIARSQRCAYAITGRIVARGDSAEVYLELHDVAGDSVIVRAPGQAVPVSESWRGGMRAVTRILPSLIPTAVPDVEATWASRPPQAVAHFLEGEAAFRRVRLPEALAAFEAAIAADSTFGLAAMRGAQVAAWDHQPRQAQAILGVALRQPLSERDQLFGRGFLAYLDGRTDSAVINLRAALALDSSMVVAWLQLGEVYMHRLPAEGATDSLAEAAFEQARALDSTAAVLQFHLVELRARRGDQAGAASIARQFARTAVDTQLVQEVELVAACGPAGFSGVNLREAAEKRPLPLLLSAKALGSSERTARCAMSADSALLLVDTVDAGPGGEGRRWFALIGRSSGLLTRGDPEAAVAAIEQLQHRWGQGRSLYELFGPAFPELADSARSMFRQDSLTYAPTFAEVRYTDTLWKLGVWAAWTGQPELAGTIAGRLAARASTSGLRVDSVLAESMAAHVALATGDSAGAVLRFEALLTRPAAVEELSWNQGASLGFDRLVLGRLLLARSDPARALGVLEVLDSPVPAVFPLYRRASLAARIEAAEALGRPALVTTLRSRLAALSAR
jgi:serine/threonine protein kinase/tetratricopeptide (TPR) repeat protein